MRISDWSSDVCSSDLAGVGKTEVAKTLARWTGGELIRVQCYEGLDAAQTMYEWDHARQLLHLRTAEATGDATARGSDALESELYTERFLVRRPLLQAIAPTQGARSEEHTSELQSLMRISYAVFSLEKKTNI